MNIKRIISTDSNSEKNDYLKSNWWPGRLRPYESVYSFITNYSALNGINNRYSSKYFSKIISNSVLDEQCKRLSILTGEDTDLIETMLMQPDRIEDLHRFGLYRPKVNTFKFCPRCIQYGFHSYIHDYVWLTRCPLHFMLLKSVTDRPDSHSDHRLFDLMTKHCKGWPRSVTADSAIQNARNNGYVKLILAWLNSVYSKANNMIKEEIWSNTAYEDLDIEDANFAFGKICRIEAMPAVLEPLTLKQEKWALSSKTFTRSVLKDVFPILKKVDFDEIYGFYKTVSAYSSQPPRFIIRLRAIQARIQKLHKHKKCIWSLRRAAWNYQWVKFNNPNDVTLTMCPYNFILDDFELAWRGTESALSTRNKSNFRYWFAFSAKNLNKLGLFGQEFEFSSSDRNQEAIPSDVLKRYKWKKTSLAKVMDAVAEWELDVEFAFKKLWLKKIEEGANPYDKLKFFGSVRLVESHGVLTLFKWQSQQT